MYMEAEKIIEAMGRKDNGNNTNTKRDQTYSVGFKKILQEIMLEIISVFISADLRKDKYQNRWSDSRKLNQRAKTKVVRAHTWNRN